MISKEKLSESYIDLFYAADAFCGRESPMSRRQDVYDRAYTLFVAADDLRMAENRTERKLRKKNKEPIRDAT